MSAISGQGYTFSVTFFSQATGSLLLNPTITAADFEVSTDGGAYTALASTPTVTPAGSYNVEVTLTSAEVGTSNHSVKMIDASGSEWKSLIYHETVQASSGGASTPSAAPLTVSIPDGSTEPFTITMIEDDNEDITFDIKDC